MHFFKYHGLGNDYLVLDPAKVPPPLNSNLRPAWVQAICDRHRGIGGDGIVYGPIPNPLLPDHQFPCEIWNPDGSQAEMSGNGLRIFARYLCDAGYLVADPPHSELVCTLLSEQRHIPVKFHASGEISVGLGTATIHPLAAFPDPAQPPAEVAHLGEPIAVNVGNPHCVFFPDPKVIVDRTLACHWGPLVETAPQFPHRTNVQFARVLDSHTLRIEIWERGAGYTLASGSSSCAAAVAAVTSRRCASPVTVQMPGGRLTIQIAQKQRHCQVTLTGSVVPVASGTFDIRWLQSLLT